jgi:hypothetical protein
VLAVGQATLSFVAPSCRRSDETSLPTLPIPLRMGRILVSRVLQRGALDSLVRARNYEALGSLKYGRGSSSAAGSSKRPLSRRTRTTLATLAAAGGPDAAIS